VIKKLHLQANPYKNKNKTENDLSNWPTRLKGLFCWNPQLTKQHPVLSRETPFLQKQNQYCLEKLATWSDLIGWRIFSLHTSS